MVDAAESWVPEDGIHVAGKPLTEIWAAPGLEWQSTLRERIRGPLRNPCLAFTRKDRSWYDLDNLAYPVLFVAGFGACDSVWATVTAGLDEGVLIREQAPPPPPQRDACCSVRIAAPSRSSVRDRPAVPELADVRPFGNDEPLGMAIQFDSVDVPVGDLSFEGPLKSLIDDLTPLFGERMISGRPMAKDYRVRELRITRGHRPGSSGVAVTLWML